MLGRGCRSDYGLSDPIIKRMKADPFFEVILVDLVPTSFGDSYFRAKALLLYFKPDAFLAIGDRVEMCAATAAAFHTNIPIIHYGAGITNNSISTYDDINRHCITLWSELALCEDVYSAINTRALWESIEKIDSEMGAIPLEEQNIYVVGITHLDDLIIDESLVLKIPYDLVLYNPPTMSTKEEQIKEYEDLQLLLVKRKVIWIGSNPDPSIIKYPHRIDYENLPRPQFLGLLKNCSRYITNSSSAYYEAPQLGLKPEQIVMIGERNKNRSTPIIYEKGASDKIVKIIKEWWLKR